MIKKQFQTLQALETNGKEPRNKVFLDLVTERTREIAELKGGIDYGSLMFVTTTARLCDFNK